MYFESFKEGQDQGIDFRCAQSEHGSIILQCKRIKEAKSLIHNLKKEIEKVEKLKPGRYIVVSACSLSPDEKEIIKSMFSDYIHQTDDIFGRQDLNNLLSGYNEIEKKHFKLWLPSLPILQSVLHSNVLFNTESEEEELRLGILKYVVNDSLTEAINSLNKNNFVIISGIPGIGKTTLARLIVYKYLQEGFELVNVSKDIEDSVEKLCQGSCDILYVDGKHPSNTIY